MDDEHSILALYDLHWFRSFILLRPSPPIDESPPISEVSDRADSLFTESSPTLLLHTIPSGTIATLDLDPFAPPAVSGDRRSTRGGDRRRGRRRREKEGSKSLSELEFEEVKGFKDLGFTFSDAEASDPWLVSILPGLQRVRVADGGEWPAAEMSPNSEAIEVPVAVTRPYLSEAWDATEDEEIGRVLRNWRVPAEGEGVVMKDHLRFWAHAVASAVR